MKKIEVLIITEGNNKLGLGHIYSCLSLYQSFETENVSVRLIVNGDSTVKELLVGKKYLLIDWLAKNNKEKIDRLINKSSVVIVDSLFASMGFYKDISCKVKVPVFFDYNKRLNYPRGVIINRTLNAHKLEYPVKNDKIYLLGTRYFPLTKAFWYVPEKIISKKINNILITFGGSDPNEMTPQVLKFLNKKYENFNKFVIIGKAFNNILIIKKLINKRTKLFFHPNGETVKKIMMDSDIAISAGGQTLFELARIGVPTIAVTVADNQKNNIKSLLEEGFIEYAGNWDDKSFYSNITELMEKLKNFEFRKRKNIIGRNLIDGYGSVRIANFILGLANRI